MYRTFVTGIPLQGKYDLKKVIYHPKNFSLGNNVKTSFPIVPVIREYMEKPENCRVITVRTENSDTEKNHGILLEELKELGIQETQVTPLMLREDQKEVASKKTLMIITDAIEDDSIVYADITFGTKPMSAAIQYAMSLVEYLKDAEVGGLYYGEIKRIGGKDTGDCFLYDMSELKRMTDIMISMDRLDLQERREAIRRLFGI